MPTRRRLIVAERLAASEVHVSDYFLQRCRSWIPRKWRLAGVKAGVLPNLLSVGTRPPGMVEQLLCACRFDQIVVPRASSIPRAMRAAVVVAATRLGVSADADASTM